MNIFKRIKERRKARKALKAKENDCWYNNAHEKKRRRWHDPSEGYYDGTHHDMAVTNSISKRQN